MIRVAIALTAACLAACAPLKSAPLPELGRSEYGRVISQRVLDIPAGETAGERASVAIITLNPIVVVGAALAVQDERGLAQISEYDVTLVDGRMTTVRSRYIVQPGQCVLIRRADDPDYVLIVAQDDARCGSTTTP